MKKYLSLILVLLGTVTLFVPSGKAEVKVWQLDKAHSNFYFSVDHIFSKVNGHFNDFTTEVKFDPANLAESSFSFKIEIASVDTNIAKRDKHLQSEDFFNTGKHPFMTFESVGVTDAGNNVYEVKGKFMVKGKAYDLTLPLTLAGVKTHPAVKGKNVAGFNGHLSIDRLAYGIGNGKFYDMGVVGKDVDIFISLELLSGN